MTEENKNSSTNKQSGSTLQGIVLEYLGVLWPDITTEKKARQFIQVGFGASLFVAAMYSVLYLLAVGKYLDYTIPPYFNLIIMLFSVVSFGLYNNSRIAAIVGFLAFLPCWLLLYQVIGVLLEVIMAVLIVMLVAGVRGAFTYHKLLPQKNDTKK